MLLDRKRCRPLLQNFDFRNLFIDELGWDTHKATLDIPLKSGSTRLESIANKRGFVVWHCLPKPDGELPDPAFRRHVEREITKTTHEHLIIFTDDAKTKQVWQWVRRDPGQPLRVRDTDWCKGQSGEAILQKLDPLFVSLDDEETLTLLDVTSRARANVSERITKRFYDEFRKQHKAFLSFISGIPNQGDHEWYASVMLNRLMFVYFVQKKGFLDGDTDYLRNRLNQLKAKNKGDQFYSFYRVFLLRLFHEGLGSKGRKSELEKLIGRVPYLNGGIFDVHQLERDYGKDIQIPDQAFEAIFDYFDRYHWHLDERPLRADNEINPDVLGYIFEKYINQKQMGAYYTKEDITEYIGKSTIIPFIFDSARAKCKIAFENPGGSTVWDLLKENPDRYIYPAVRHGCDLELPKEIAAGLERSDGILPSATNNRRQDAVAPFFNPDTEIQTHRTNLPHWQQDEAWQFVTWRLADSLPQEKLIAWQTEKDTWLTLHPEPWDDTTQTEFHQQFTERINQWLDAGHGSCLLKNPEYAKIVADALRHFDGERYTLGPFVVMPNHVHVLFQPLKDHTLEEIVHSWKSFTANQINKKTSKTGTLWQRDYWDTMIRSEQHWHACRQYILDNPAKLSQGTFERSDGILPSSNNNRRQDAVAPLIERRKHWNKPAPAEYALPTEIWREVIARRQRYEEIHRKLAHGEVHEINDFITLNLDLRQFAQDVIQNCEAPDLLMAIWNVLSSMSILDPTGGSGAFLFAALSILEPLYEGCLDRMEGFLAEWERSDGFQPSSKQNGRQDAVAPLRHPNYHKKFSAILANVSSHPNRRYFVLKSIILNNLYAVDIMEEAVEICKLRLFLKLAAQVEPDESKDNLGIEPLPDIDFNIRCGNTLVGYATYEEVKRAVTSGLDFDNAMEKIATKAADLQQTFDSFRQFQTQGDGNVPAEHKKELQKRLKALEDELNRHLASEYGVRSDGILPSNSSNRRQDAVAPYDKWLKSHQPFHWFIHFYGILKNGGFDVIIGNPPWKEYSAVKKAYTVRGYVTESSGNLYALCTERSLAMLSPSGFLSFIVQLPIVSSSRMENIRAFLLRNASFVATITCDDRPGKLFEGLQHCRSTIFLLQRRKVSGNTSRLWSSGYRRWASAVREFLFPVTIFAEVGEGEIQQGQFPKLTSQLQVSAYAKLFARSNRLLGLETNQRATKDFVFYQESAQYWVKATLGLPHYAKNGRIGAPAHGRYLYFEGIRHPRIACAILNSSLFYSFFIAYSDCFHVSDTLATSFPVPPSALEDKALETLGTKLMRDLERNSERKSINTKDGDKIAYDEFRVGESKPIIDEIDTVLAAHYGFTEEELDFIINYDIKYRLGRSGGEDEG